MCVFLRGYLRQWANWRRQQMTRWPSGRWIITAMPTITPFLCSSPLLVVHWFFVTFLTYSLFAGLPRTRQRRKLQRQPQQHRQQQATVAVLQLREQQKIQHNQQKMERNSIDNYILTCRTHAYMHARTTACSLTPHNMRSYQHCRQPKMHNGIHLL